MASPSWRNPRWGSTKLTRSSFVVVNLGCSSGDNTIYIVNVIIKHMTKHYEALGQEPPEFSAFFSDLPSNDFNTLFQLLPPLANYGGGSMEECLAADNHRSYFAAGVPSSFYRRLFPAKSIDVFHSAFSLHWLSQVNYKFDSINLKNWYHWSQKK